MSIGKEIGKATWDNYKAPFFKWVERKAKEGAKRYTFLGKVRDAWMKADWGYAEQEYLKYIYEFHSQFRVFGIQETVELDDLATDVFVLEKPEFRKYDQSEKTTKIGGLKLVFQDKRGKKLFVWGEPGVGKTTFLKQILSYAIDNTDKIPLFVNIAEWAATHSLDKEGLLKYITLQFEHCGFSNATIFIEYIIDEGFATLLFDGLDEISNDQRQKVLLLFEQYKGTKSQIIITCRVGATGKHLKGYWEIQIARWDERRVQDFLRKRLTNKESRKKFIEEINDGENKSLNDFKRNPLLLSLLCSVFDAKKGFPKKRTEIYYAATQHLLVERDQEKGNLISRYAVSGALTLAQKEILYEHIAYNFLTKEKTYFSRQELELEIDEILTIFFEKEKTKLFDSQILLQELVSQHGLLARKGYHTYAFSHLTFQEYYTARYIIKNKSLEKLTVHISNPLWREVFLLVANNI